MDKLVYLLNRSNYRKEFVENLSQRDLEDWVAAEDYTENYTILKIDANGYSSADEALSAEMGYVGNCVDDFLDDYYVLSFGF